MRTDPSNAGEVELDGPNAGVDEVDELDDPKDGVDELDGPNAGVDGVDELHDPTSELGKLEEPGGPKLGVPPVPPFPWFAACSNWAPVEAKLGELEPEPLRNPPAPEVEDARGAPGSLPPPGYI